MSTPGNIRTAPRSVLRAVRFVWQGGRCVGVDSSGVMVAEAQSRSQGGTQVEFFQADARSLPFPDASFDACRAERVLQHVDDPRAALSEMWRVARPGARVAAAEPDYGDLTIIGGDLALTRRILDCRRGHFRSSRIGLQLPILFKRQGFEDVSVARIHLENAGFAQDRDYLHKLAVAAQEAGAARPDECVAWLRELEQAAEADQYSQGFVVYLVSGRKP